MVVLPDPASDKWPFFGHVYLRQDSLPSSHHSRHHRSRDETLRLWNYYLPLDPQKDQFKFVLFLQRLMTMVEEHYRKRHSSRDWKVSKPIEDWYHQSIRDLSGLGIDENLMSREWREVVQKGNQEAAKKERKEAEKVHLEKMEKEKDYRYHRYRGERRRRSYYEPSDSSYDDESSEGIVIHYHKHKPSKSKSPTKEKEKEKDHPKGTPKWVICLRRSKHCSREHEMVKCNGRCGLTACVEDAHRCHKIYIDYECTDPECEKCKKIKERQEAWEKKVANPTHEEKWVDCPCEDPWCRRKVMEIKEIPKPPKPRFYGTKP
ncbi:hypothetical protein BCON_0085g00030 [Botryotinia convoluta]|uniref:Uncharacterized protein n=1 Tax=Botryotinia convoluta TaxID=54673 RepID=A0A4Z1IGJ8_9HELO|nr:hypothetical protein BCON_0085g00030 [Botryotinia convoluta]